MADRRVHAQTARMVAATGGAGDNSRFAEASLMTGLAHNVDQIRSQPSQYADIERLIGIWRQPAATGSRCPVTGDSYT